MPTALQAATKYRWNMRSISSSGVESGVSAYLYFQTPGPPPPPIARAASAVTANSFTANWDASSGASGYRLDVSTSGAFTSFVPGYQNLDVANVLSRNVSGLSASTTYYYRVRAYNAQGTSASSGTINVMTTIDPNTAPSAPVNLLPANNATDQSLTPTLQASLFFDVDGDFHSASQWQLLNSAGNSVIWDSLEDAANKTTKAVPIGTLAEATSYWWQVRYKDSRGAWSEYSAATTFTTEGQPCLASLVTPIAGANIPSPPSFSWSFTGSCSHRIYLSTNPAPDYILAISNRFSSGTHTFTLTEDRWNLAMERLGVRETYYWTIGDADTLQDDPPLYAVWRPFSIVLRHLTTPSLANGTLQVRLNGAVGSKYVFESSMTFGPWTPIATNTIPPEGWMIVTDPNASTHSRKFYRARLLSE